MTEKYNPEAVYMLQYHSPQSGKTEVKQFSGFFPMIWFLLSEGRRALISGRYQIVKLGGKG